MLSNDNNSGYDFASHPSLLAGKSIDVLKSHHSLAEFKHLHPELADLTYSDWIKFVNSIEATDGESLAASFVVPPGLKPFSTGIAAALAGKAMNLGRAATIDDFADSAAEFVKEQVRQRVSGTNIPRDLGESDGGDGGDGATSTANYAGGSNFNPTGLSLNLKPVDIEFKSGIVPLYRPKFFLDGGDQTSPLILRIKNVYPELAPGSNTSYWAGTEQIQTYIENKVVADWLNLISRKVRLNSFTSGLVNKDHIINYYTTISYCLAVLYFHLSVDAHFRMEKNRNDGMIALYRSLSVSDLQQISILRQVLDEIPLDPMVNQLMFHLYGNYKQSHLPGSPLLKFIPIKFKDSVSSSFDDGLEENRVSDCLKLLRNKKFRDFQQIYVQAFPQSVETKTYSYSGVPRFDANFLTCFVNSEKIGATSTASYLELPRVVNESSSIIKNLQTDAPDGWIDACSSMYDTTNQKHCAGFGGYKFPSITTEDEFFTSNTTRSQYVEGSGNKVTSSFIYTKDNNGVTEVSSFFPVEYRQRYASLVGDTYQTHVSSSVAGAFQRFGSESALPMTIRDNIPVAQQFTDIMYTPWKFDSKGSSMANSDPSESSDSDSRSPRRSRRRRK